MQFQPKTKDKIAEEKLLPKGIYPFVVDEAEDKVSGAGNPMIALKMTFYGENKRQMIVRDWLMESKIESLEQFCRFTGMEDLYLSGNVTAQDCEGKQGWAALRVAGAKNGYGPRNEINYYCDKPKDRASSQEMNSLREQITKELSGPEEEEEPPF